MQIYGENVLAAASPSNRIKSTRHNHSIRGIVLICIWNLAKVRKNDLKILRRISTEFGEWRISNKELHELFSIIQLIGVIKKTQGSGGYILEIRETKEHY